MQNQDTDTSLASLVQLLDGLAGLTDRHPGPVDADLTFAEARAVVREADETGVDLPHCTRCEGVGWICRNCGKGDDCDLEPDCTPGTAAAICCTCPNGVSGNWSQAGWA